MENKKYTLNQSDGFSSLRGAQRQSNLQNVNEIASPLARNDVKQIAVLLVNFGGPSGLSEVKPFLYNLFSDPVVLNFPFAFLYRKPLAWLISNMRDMTSREMYKKIGSVTPLIPVTLLQAGKLQTLIRRNELPIDVYVGFRYCKPFIEDVLSDICSKNYKKLIILPLYPQYSYTTTGSVELVLNDCLSRKQKEISIPEVQLVKHWYKDEDYIQAYSSLISNSLENLDLRSTEILFSAHSIPQFNIENGDPYEKQITETCELIIKKLNWKKKWHLAYQSKLGPVKWLEPSTGKVIEEIACKNKNTNILVVPVSFVSEHVETIYEIGMLYKDIAKRCGIKRFARVPALNMNKYLIQALYNQVIGCLENSQIDIKELIRTI